MSQQPRDPKRQAAETRQSTDDDVCPVCCDAYTKHHRKRVTCAYCDMTCCGSCFQTYLLTLQADAHCMGCKRVMDAEFVATHVPKTWLLGKYKHHRESVLLDREKALLPDSQNMLENYRDAQALRAELVEHEAQRKALQRQVAQMAVTARTMRDRLEIMERSQYTRRPPPIDGPDNHNNHNNNNDGNAQSSRRQFIRSCPMEDCRGFLSTAWRCGTCETWVCKDCGEPKLNGQHDDEHVCDPNIAASHALLQRDTRPCPKCASMIFKIDGCFGGEVAVRLWDSTKKLAREVVVGDVLVGDDAEPRRVVHTFTGQDDLYAISSAGGGGEYVVSSQHTLVLSYCGADTLHMTVHEFLTHVPDRHKALMEGLAVLPPDTSAAATAIAAAAVPTLSLTGPVSVSPIGVGTYFGWEVDGPTRRFLLADGTVVHNCDQMWCTQCQVAFSWRTGQVVTNGIIHNPHYYAWVREHNNGQVPRNPADVPCGGGGNNNGLPGMYTIEGVLRRHTAPGEVNSALRAFHRTTRHVAGVDMPRLRREAGPADDPQHARNADLRLKYLLKQIDEAQWKTKLQQREKRRERALAVMHVYDMFVAVSTDVFRGLLDGARTPEAACDELRHIRTYANTHLATIAKRFNMHVGML